MKKKLITIAAIGSFLLLVAAYSLFSMEKTQVNSLVLENIEALARDEINPDCPNGCHSCGDGCYCYIYYSYFEEHKWPD